MERESVTLMMKSTVLKELAEEFDLDPNELDIQKKKDANPNKSSKASDAESQSVPTDKSVIKEFADEYGMDADSLGANDELVFPLDLQFFASKKDKTKMDADGGESGKYTVDEIALKHSSVGDFTYNPKTGEVSRMKGGGHGQANIDFLEANGMEYNIVHVYDNGVRIGNVPKHKTPSKRTGTGQAWFPKTWSDNQIKEAGEYVARLAENENLADGIIAYGEYEGVRVGIIKTNGKVGTIFPDADLQP